ncbi:ABC transporter permease [Aestuariimicrobium sp. Y1814]|uniref:ABC transporter permease n=1 Tax=Aestuariimicrobium sp. Y1814 TaxID=3418742 RepID=UPI003DA75A5A
MKRFTLWAGIVLVAGLVVTAVVATFWTPHDPVRVETSNALQPPSATHLLGTDPYGIDILSKVMAGAATCLQVGVIAVAIASLVGIPLGITVGMSAQSWWSRLLLRVSDLFYAFPALLLAILLAAAVGASTVTAMVAIGIATIPVFVRMARAGAMQVMTRDYVASARVSGISWPAIGVQHVLPNIAPLLGVQASVSFAMAILAEAALSYLGLGAPVSQPTWGRMVLDAQRHIFTSPGLTVWPALAIGAAVLGFNLLGDGLRDRLDPLLREVS